MKKILFTAVFFAVTPVMAANIDSPPPLDTNEKASAIREVVTPAPRKEMSQEQVQRLKERKVEERRQAEASSKKELEKAKKRTKDPSTWPKTKIEETVNNRGQVTEVTVTPMSTQIPYKMTREDINSPANADSAAGKGNTMSVPKFINFGF